jgi:hypothetical protein
VRKTKKIANGGLVHRCTLRCMNVCKRGAFANGGLVT